MPANKIPIANAGPNITFDISLCAVRRYVELDGSASYDPENLPMRYEWKKLSGPNCTLSEINSAQAHVSYFEAGKYSFELTVWDKEAQSAKDTTELNVVGTPAPMKVQLDLNVTQNYSFKNDTLICYEHPLFGNICEYYDYTESESVVQILPFGGMTFWVIDYADTAKTVLDHETQMGLYTYAGNSPYVWGTTFIDFKKLIAGGGGNFLSVWQLVAGTASYCDPNFLSIQTPLIISGSIDTVTRKINLKVQGKVYF